MLHTGIPSPSQGVWYIGVVPIRAYAIIIITGIAVGLWVANRRWVARGGASGTVVDIAMWAVPSGIVGARIWHVATHAQDYFGPGIDPLSALRLWEGGLAIFGGLLFGGLGAWYACRRRGIPLPAYADALAPGIAIAQAIGRFGNYFNQEFFGRPTDLPWGLQIDPGRRPPGFEQFETFHPTFLYESLWSVGVALVVIWVDRRFRLGHGRAFAVYVALYALGRTWVEYLRIDPSNLVLGVRVNLVAAVLVILGAVVYVVVSARLRPGRETVVEPAAVTEPQEQPRP